MITYVTSLYAVRQDYLPVLYAEFQKLQQICLSPILVFTDKELPFPYESHVQVLHTPLKSFQTYMNCMVQLQLPRYRNLDKDTQEFMALMNTKVEMVWRALPYVKTKHVAWIDAGILKIVKDPMRVSASFASHTQYSWPSNVCIPGCWDSALVSLQDQICWRFCGGFLVLPATFVEPFYTKVQACLAEWIQKGHIAWEVNVWASMEEKDPSLFTWWKADHNESMLEPMP